jgi:hypothetical protein
MRDEVKNYISFAASKARTSAGVTFSTGSGLKEKFPTTVRPAFSPRVYRLEEAERCGTGFAIPQSIKLKVRKVPRISKKEAEPMAA